MIKQRASETFRTADGLHDRSPSKADYGYRVHSGTNPEERGTRMLPVVSTHVCPKQVVTGLAERG